MWVDFEFPDWFEQICNHTRVIHFHKLDVRTMVRTTRKVLAFGAATAAVLCGPKETFVPGPLVQSRAMAAVPLFV